MFTRWCAPLLILLLAGSGCQTTSSPDPLGQADRSLLSRLAPQGRAFAGGRGAAPGGDPFVQSTPPPAADRTPVGRAGRAVLTDGFEGELHAPVSQGAEALAARPARQQADGIIPVGGLEERRQVGGPSGPFGSESAGASATADAAALRQQLQDLEWDLQFTDDHARQEQLALEIARLRKQLARSGL